jgi:hypothetical protein
MSRTRVARQSELTSALRMAAASNALAGHLEQRPSDTIPIHHRLWNRYRDYGTERARKSFTPADIPKPGRNSKRRCRPWQCVTATTTCGTSTFRLSQTFRPKAVAHSASVAAPKATRSLSDIARRASENSRGSDVCHFLNPSLQPRQREQTSDLRRHRPIQPRRTLSECQLGFPTLIVQRHRAQQVLPRDKARERRSDRCWFC